MLLENWVFPNKSDKEKTSNDGIAIVSWFNGVVTWSNNRRTEDVYRLGKFEFKSDS